MCENLLSFIFIVTYTLWESGNCSEEYMGLQVRGFVMRFSASSADFPLLHGVHAGLEARQTSYSMAIQVPFLGVKTGGA
jgi:hypothetical protein